jgi:hypothetical protein
MNNRRLLVWIPVLALLCNGLGYVVVSKLRASGRSATATTTAGSGARSGNAATEDASKEAEGRARRAAGLAALEAGDYGKALINFTEARSLLGERARVDDLLRVTEDLRSRSRATDPAPTASVTAASPPQARAFGWPRAAARPPWVPRPPAPAPEPPPAETHSPPAPTSTGLLLVTTTPRGLLVQVDGVTVDLTPMRSSVKTGPHRVVLLDGDRKVYETSVDIGEGTATTVLKDLTAEIAPERRGNLLAAMKEDSARPPVASPPPASVEPISTPTSKAVVSNEPGGLDITSPGIYGVIWVNGRPQGYPPLQARDLPPGPTKIEVRVNGVEKRSTTVLVQPGSTTAVKLR